MLGQDARVPVAQLVQQAGGTFDIGEEERHRAAGEVAHGVSIGVAGAAVNMLSRAGLRSGIDTTDYPASFEITPRSERGLRNE